MKVVELLDIAILWVEAGRIILNIIYELKKDDGRSSFFYRNKLVAIDITYFHIANVFGCCSNKLLDIEIELIT